MDNNMMQHFSKLTFEKLISLTDDVIRTNKKIEGTNIEFINVESAFDIETTSMKTQNKKVAYMYIWQFGIVDEVFYGRTWEEFITFMNFISDSLELSETRRLVTYVHNLGYEFQFMSKYFEWLDVFAVSERKPIKAVSSIGVEFRDSLILSGYSLENTAKNLVNHKIDKLCNNLDYSLIRHHETELSDEEMKYCENDVLIILAYINEQISQYSDISKIPLTNTGRVRNYVKNECYYSSKNHKKSSKSKYTKYRKIMNDLTLTEESYIQLKRAFMGGFTHSNPSKTNVVLECVDSVDLTSSYPTVMLSDKFPMSRPKSLKIYSLNGLEEAFKKYCVVFDVKFAGLDNKLKYESYLSESKCFNKKDVVINNGRIYSAREVSSTITDVDFNIIKNVYTWESMQISNVTGYVKNYLPKPIIESILDLYEKKTTLKDVKGSEVEYLLSKGMLNSVYGMCVTDFMKDNHTFTNCWEVEKVEASDSLESYNTSKNRFLYYPWGIWITAYARRNLWMTILNVGEDYIYSDTDSVKMLNYSKHTKYIDGYNLMVTKKLTLMMNYYSLNVDRLCPKTIEGIDKPLGVWEHEGHYNKFKTLGAKRYLIEQNGNYHLTVAGLSKSRGMEHIKKVCRNSSEKIFNMFSDSLYIAGENTGKMTHTYIDESLSVLVEDYKGRVCEVHTLGGVHLSSCEFTLSISSKYKTFLNNLMVGYSHKGRVKK